MQLDMLELLGKIAKEIKFTNILEIVIDPLIKLLKTTQQKKLLRKGVWTLSYILENVKEDKVLVSKIIDPLIDGLNSSDWYTRANCCWILGHIAENVAYSEVFSVLSQAINPLIAVLKDNESTVRENAAEVLGHMANNSNEEVIIDLIHAIAPLIEAVKDKEWKVRDNAIWCLGHIASKVTSKIMQQHLERVIDPLIDLLQDKHECYKVRNHAMDTLNSIIKNMDDSKSIENIIKALVSFF